jgi:hypothetical protein
MLEQRCKHLALISIFEYSIRRVREVPNIAAAIGNVLYSATVRETHVVMMDGSRNSRR